MLIDLKPRNLGELSQEELNLLQSLGSLTATSKSGTGAGKATTGSRKGAKR